MNPAVENQHSCHSILRLNQPTEGEIIFKGQDLTSLNDAELRAIRKEIQIVFQDPLASLNLRMTIGAMLSEAMRFHNVVEPTKVEERAAWLLELCGLNADALRRFPHEFPETATENWHRRSLSQFLRSS